MTDTITHKHLTRRHRNDRLFQLCGIGGVALSLLFLAILFYTIISGAIPAFSRTVIEIEVIITADDVSADNVGSADYNGIIKRSLYALFPRVTSRRDKKSLTALLSTGAQYMVRDHVMADPSLIGQPITMKLPASSNAHQYALGAISEDTPEDTRRLNDKQIAWYKKLDTAGRIHTEFNTVFFSAADSREPELAGVLGALMGSLFSMLVTLLLAAPVGVAGAIYLEEFARKNFLTHLIEVNINNLAAVPSIVFGLLALAVFLNFFDMPRSAPLVGGMALALMTLPTIIIATRSSLKSVPPSVRQAALGLGASQMQTITHHVLPLAMPGIMTGIIIGLAQALGETAPLLMIGMVAFIVDIPASITDPATALPVQIYLWADSPERGFVELTSAAILVLLVFLITMNLVAVILRKKFERRW